jgi:hypothetical protein
MSWLDRVMDRLTQRGTKVVGAGHPPGDTQPETGAPPSERTIEFGQELPEQDPPPGRAEP